MLTVILFYFFPFTILNSQISPTHRWLFKKGNKWTYKLTIEQPDSGIEKGIVTLEALNKEPVLGQYPVLWKIFLEKEKDTLAHEDYAIEDYINSGLPGKIPDSLKKILGSLPKDTFRSEQELQHYLDSLEVALNKKSGTTKIKGNR